MVLKTYTDATRHLLSDMTTAQLSRLHTATPVTSRSLVLVSHANEPAALLSASRSYQRTLSGLTQLSQTDPPCILLIQLVEFQRSDIIYSFLGPAPPPPELIQRIRRTCFVTRRANTVSERAALISLGQVC